ncbi:hypothetical protein D0809_03925 [Flavobacterium circumlabens]|uniref:DUF2846 domain-containing protein n=1 Tax=Flavobacterium circumlabens TaxID=2133765 RepID=A0A4Y7UI75_9FLAO|nr:hypothetical protein [Flavobacterium circumlabens]TCN61038.1 hypothetical protein EV142_101621 [Flavobacterium circumlabens]TEB46153.1 hypothetical protein D0809_03925 [Flavobacterium circumlabens]
MRNNILKTIRRTALFSTLLLVCSCGLKSIPSDYTFIKGGFEKVELDKLGNGKILIYNGADISHKIDNTARLNIWIDDKPLGQLRASEYVIIDLKNGIYQFKVQHLDLVNMRSIDEVEIDEKTRVIKIKANLTSNKLTITNELPKNFDKFRYSEKK